MVDDVSDGDFKKWLDQFILDSGKSEWKAEHIKIGAHAACDYILNLIKDRQFEMYDVTSPEHEGVTIKIVHVDEIFDACK